jgi:organic hydroperoxide reductase OsmC/OhrA
MQYRYRTRVRWTGNLGSGTREYRGYRRDHSLEVDGKPPILATSGLAPGSDPARHNPDELLVAALSSCHMLWYLHLCSEAGVVVVAYVDEAEGTLETGRGGSGRFVEAVLRPRVTLAEGSPEVARRLHEEAHARCFVANSVNFPVRCEPTIEPARPGSGPAGPSSAPAEATRGRERTRRP